MKTQTAKGFTLIELMIVVVIIGILATIAYPSYTKWVVQSRRTDGQIALTTLANDMEKFFAECSAYPTSLTAARTCAGLGLGRTSAQSLNGTYTLSIALASGGYTLTAAPQGVQASKDTECASLTLTNTGVKNATGTAPSRCWKK